MPAAAEDVAKHIAENVEDRLAIVEIGHADVTESGMAVAIVDLAFLGVADDGIGLGRLLELVGGVFIAQVAVGMVLHRQRAISLLQLLFAGVLLDAQDLVIVPFRCHVSHWFCWVNSTASLNSSNFRAAGVLQT